MSPKEKKNLIARLARLEKAIDDALLDVHRMHSSWFFLSGFIYPDKKPFDIGVSPRRGDRARLKAEKSGKALARQLRDCLGLEENEVIS